jgi:hypothetical protein
VEIEAITLSCFEVLFVRAKNRLTIRLNCLGNTNQGSVFYISDVQQYLPLCLALELFVKWLSS